MKDPRPLRTLALLLWAAAMLMISAPAASVTAQSDPYLKVQGGASFLGEWTHGVASPGTAAYGAKAGFRWPSVDFGLVAEHNIWLLNNLRDNTWFPTSVLNVGLQAGITYYDGFVRSGLSGGTSTLLIETTVTEGAGHTGLFGEVQPIALRIPTGSKWTVEIEVLNLIIMAPILEAIPLIELAYRTTVGIERRF